MVMRGRNENDNGLRGSLSASLRDGGAIPRVQFSNGVFSEAPQVASPFLRTSTPPTRGTISTFLNMNNIINTVLPSTSGEIRDERVVRGPRFSGPFVHNVNSNDRRQAARALMDALNGRVRICVFNVYNICGNQRCPLLDSHQKDLWDFAVLQVPKDKLPEELRHLKDINLDQVVRSSDKNAYYYKAVNKIDLNNVPTIAQLLCPIVDVPMQPVVVPNANNYANIMRNAPGMQQRQRHATAAPQPTTLSWSQFHKKPENKEVFCFTVSKGGRCRFGPTCRNAHNEVDQRDTPASTEFKTKLAAGNIPLYKVADKLNELYSDPDVIDLIPTRSYDDSRLPRPNDHLTLHQLSMLFLAIDGSQDTGLKESVYLNKISQQMYRFISDLFRRTKMCNLKKALNAGHVTNENGRSNTCFGGKNCFRGAHEVAEQICTDDLFNGECKCSLNPIEEINVLKEAIAVLDSRSDNGFVTIQTVEVKNQIKEMRSNIKVLEQSMMIHLYRDDKVAKRPAVFQRDINYDEFGDLEAVTEWNIDNSDQCIDTLELKRLREEARVKKVAEQLAILASIDTPEKYNDLAHGATMVRNADGTPSTQSYRIGGHEFTRALWTLNPEISKLPRCHQNLAGDNRPLPRDEKPNYEMREVNLADEHAWSLDEWTTYITSTLMIERSEQMVCFHYTFPEWKQHSKDNIPLFKDPRNKYNQCFYQFMDKLNDKKEELDKLTRDQDEARGDKITDDYLTNQQCVAHIEGKYFDVIAFFLDIKMIEDPRLIGTASVLINNVLKEQPRLFDAFMIVRRVNQEITFDKWLETNHSYALKYKMERPDVNFGLLLSYVHKEVGTRHDITLNDYLQNPELILQWVSRIQPRNSESKSEITLEEYLKDSTVCNLYILSLYHKHGDIGSFRKELEAGWTFVPTREQPAMLANLLEADLLDLVKVFNPNAYSKFNSRNDEIVIVDQVGCIKNDTVANPLNKVALAIVRLLKTPNQDDMLQKLQRLNADLQLKYTDYSAKVEETKAFASTPFVQGLKNILDDLAPKPEDDLELDDLELDDVPPEPEGDLKLTKSQRQAERRRAARVTETVPIRARVSDDSDEDEEEDECKLMEDDDEDEDDFNYAPKNRGPKIFEVEGKEINIQSDKSHIITRIERQIVFGPLSLKNQDKVRKVGIAHGVSIGKPKKNFDNDSSESKFCFFPVNSGKYRFSNEFVIDLLSSLDIDYNSICNPSNLLPSKEIIDAVKRSTMLAPVQKVVDDFEVLLKDLTRKLQTADAFLLKSVGKKAATIKLEATKNALSAQVKEVSDKLDVARKTLSNLKSGIVQRVDDEDDSDDVEDDSDNEEDKSIVLPPAFKPVNPCDLFDFEDVAEESEVKVEDVDAESDSEEEEEEEEGEEEGEGEEEEGEGEEIAAMCRFESTKNSTQRGKGKNLKLSAAERALGKSEEKRGNKSRRER
jgi:hypothetical protein